MLKTSGRTARGEYLATALLWLIVLAAGGISLGALPLNYKAAGLVAYIVMFVVAFATFRRMAIRRAHDLGRSGPRFFALFMGISLLLKKGDTDQNEYGQPPTWQSVGIAWALVIGAWMLFLKVIPFVANLRNL